VAALVWARVKQTSQARSRVGGEDEEGREDEEGGRRGSFLEEQLEQATTPQALQ